MIARSIQAEQPQGWQDQLARAITDPAELLRRMDLDPGLLPAARRATRLFRLRVPESFVARMRPGDPDDPLLRQVLPLHAETLPAPGYIEDPLAEARAVTTPGVLQKYHGRVLLVATGACAINCRYCFRRHFPYAAQNAATGRWQRTLEHVAADTSLQEVILSGGDPLVLTNGRLTPLVEGLAAIDHVHRLRIHTRLPVVLPDRVDAGLTQLLSQSRLRVVIVIHANHPRELDGTVDAALARFSGTDTTLLNQSVLLKGVNDDTATLAALSQRLFDAGVLPYYLHTLDPVQGAAHFAVDDATTRVLMEGLRTALPGYLVPRLVREDPGAVSKTPLA